MFEFLRSKKKKKLDFVEQYKTDLAEILDCKSKDIVIKMSNVNTVTDKDGYSRQPYNKKLTLGSSLTYYDDASPQYGAVRYKVYKKEALVTEFNLREMPFCCAYVISGEVRVMYGYRNKGIGSISHKFRLQLSKKYGYSGIICTHISDNKYQKKILRKNRWKRLFKVTNKRTNNPVHIRARKL